MEVSKPRGLRFIPSGSMIQQRLGFLVPLLMVTRERRFANWNQLAFSLFSLVNERQQHWIWPSDRNFYGHRGIPSAETAVDYVKWAVDLNVLEEGLVWSSIGLVLHVVSKREIEAWTGKTESKDLNPLRLNEMQRTLLLRLLLERDGDLYIPFLSNLSIRLKEQQAIDLIGGAEALVVTLTQMAPKFESSNEFETIQYGQKLKAVASNWANELQQRKLGRREGQCTAEHRVTPRLETCVDFLILTKDPKVDPYEYRAQELLGRFLSNFQLPLDSTLSTFFERAAKTFDLQSKPADEDEIRRILLSSHLELRDNMDVSLRPGLLLLTALTALHHRPSLIIEIDKADDALRGICHDNPNEAYILVNEFGQPVFVHVDPSFARNKTRTGG